MFDRKGNILEGDLHVFIEYMTLHLDAALTNSRLCGAREMTNVLHLGLRPKDHR